MMLIQHFVNSGWLFNTQSRGLQADWFILEFNEMANLNIKMYCCNKCWQSKDYNALNNTE